MDYNLIIDEYNKNFEKYGKNDFKTLFWNSENSAIIRYNLMNSYCEFNNKNILEVGCGFGSFFKLNYKCKNYTGIDVNLNLINSAKKEFPNYNFYNKSLEDFETEETYDLSICSGVFANRYIPLNFYNNIKDSLFKLYSKSNIVMVNFPSIYADVREPNIEFYSPELILSIALSISPNVIIDHRIKSDFLLVIKK